MKAAKAISIILAGSILSLVSGQQQSVAQTEKTVTVGNLAITYTEPAPAAVPERIKPKSETDWAAKVNNKNAEVIEVLNILNPVAAYLTAAFDQHGDKLSEMTIEEWNDTGAQLTKATKLYADCRTRMEKEKYDKKLFLDLEEAWQLLVKVGVAGVRTKTMVDDEFNRTE